VAFRVIMHVCWSSGSKTIALANKGLGWKWLDDAHHNHFPKDVCQLTE